MSPSITLQGIGKRFRTWQRAAVHNTFRDMVAAAAADLFRAHGRRERPGDGGGFWALRDITFDVMPGETVGIIGANGAGKSTLLKILASITEPTEGRGLVRGRVGSLLEVGTGFHSELTGRENIYLSGAILGMAKTDIVRKFDEIVAFAEVEPFIDTPLKHYSSGMHLRLGFSVAAHLDSSILIVDEVLAVGDERFQRKCVATMEEVSRQSGRTILFVSHNLAAVQNLCGRCLRLERGRLVQDGPARTVVADYLASLGTSVAAAGQAVDLTSTPRRGTGACRFEAAEYASDDDRLAFHPYSDGPLTFRLTVRASQEVHVSSLSVTLHDPAGTILLNADTYELGWRTRLTPGTHIVVVSIRSLHLKAGQYPVGLWLEDGNGTPLDYLERAFTVHVLSGREAPLAAGRTGVEGCVSCEFAVTSTESAALSGAHSAA